MTKIENSLDKNKPTKKASKRVAVEDVSGNRHILKATVISVKGHAPTPRRDSQYEDRDQAYKR